MDAVRISGFEEPVSFRVSVQVVPESPVPEAMLAASVVVGRILIGSKVLGVRVPDRVTFIGTETGNVGPDVHVECTVLSVRVPQRHLYRV
jgi:hypothetical protein